MQVAPIPKNEFQRLTSLYKLNLLDTPPERRFDRITKTATQIFRVPISTLTLIDDKREWFKSSQGISNRESPRTTSFCGHALTASKVFIVPDATKDARFADNPHVIQSSHLRFYAGIPISSREGLRVGVFCIKDTKARKFLPQEQEILKGLACWAEVEINFRQLDLALKKELRKNKTQEDSNTAMLNVMDDLEEALSTMKIERAKDDAMLASIGEGVIATDNKGEIIVVNKTAEKILNLKSGNLIGHSIIDLPLEYESGRPITFKKRPIYHALSSGKQINTICYYTKKNKIRIPLAINATPVKLAEKIIGAIDVFRDITTEIEMDRAKSDFVSLASHQLRTPLGILKWYIEAIIKEGIATKIPKSVKDYLNEIYKGNERLLCLVRDLLSVSRIEQGRVKDNPQSVNITQIVKDIVKEMNIFAIKDKIKIDLKVRHSRIPSLYIDPLRFREVIENLLTNAIVYSNANETVEIVIDQKDKQLFIAVTDKGIGIPKNNLKNIFSKFYRTDIAIAKNTEGTGLGLYVAKSYVEGWGGKITVTSVEGKGSTFTVTLPITANSSKINNY